MKEAILELVHNRELLFELAWRDIRIRYKQTILGAAWAICTPVIMMLIFTQIFTRVAKVDTGDVPYPIFVYCGLLPWQFFAMSLKGAVESLTRNARLVTKIYMPREVFPLAQIISSMLDFVIASGVMAALMIWYGFVPKSTMLFLPVVILVQVLFTTALALLVSMANLFYRDVKYIFEVFLMLWMFASSVVYPIKNDFEWSWLFSLNPMTIIIDAYRNVILLGELPNMLSFGWVAYLSVIMTGVSVAWFHESEYLFAENI